MNAQFGKPLKSVALLANDRKVRSEAVTSEKGLEGNRIYEITRDLRQNHDLKLIYYQIILSKNCTCPQQTKSQSKPK